MSLKALVYMGFSLSVVFDTIATQIVKAIYSKAL